MGGPGVSVRGPGSVRARARGISVPGPRDVSAPAPRGQSAPGMSVRGPAGYQCAAARIMLVSQSYQPARPEPVTAETLAIMACGLTWPMYLPNVATSKST